MYIFKHIQVSRQKDKTYFTIQLVLHSSWSLALKL